MSKMSGTSSSSSFVDDDQQVVGEEEDINVTHSQPVHLYEDEMIEQNNNTTELVRTRSQLEIENVVTRVKSDLEKQVPYTILSKHEKIMISIMVAYIGVFSAILLPIFFPILPLLKNKFQISDELMNLSVVFYLIFQGLSPTITSNLADKFGRRPVILTCLILYIAANIGLAVADLYWLILVLRCCQSGGIAPVVSISSGVVGDITQRYERGSYIGVVSGITLVGQGFGAIVGLALLSSEWGWRSIFWFLSILPGVTLVIAFFILPETRRSIVGNLSVKPKRWINTAPILLLPHFNKKLTNQLESLTPPGKAFNILQLFKIMLLPEVACALFPSSIVFATWNMALTSYTSILSSDYHYKTLHIGLCYLPAGIGCLCGSLTSGRVLDYIYKLERDKYIKKYGELDYDSKPKFNIFKARLILFIVPSFFMSAFTLIFAWTLEYKKTIVIVIIAAFFMSFCAISPVTMCTTILVDIFPGASSTSTSLVNFSRCMLSLVAVAVLTKMTKAMTLGGCYTFMAALCLLGNFFIYLVVLKGQTWVDNRSK